MPQGVEGWGDNVYLRGCVVGWGDNVHPSGSVEGWGLHSRGSVEGWGDYTPWVVWWAGGWIHPMSSVVDWEAAHPPPQEAYPRGVPPTDVYQVLLGIQSSNFFKC